MGDSPAPSAEQQQNQQILHDVLDLVNTENALENHEFTTELRLEIGGRKGDGNNQRQGAEEGDNEVEDLAALDIEFDVIGEEEVELLEIVLVVIEHAIPEVKVLVDSEFVFGTIF